jgi:hypothetical protein
MIHINQKNEVFEINSSNIMNYEEDYIDENSLWLVVKSLRHVSGFKVIKIIIIKEWI